MKFLTTLALAFLYILLSALIMFNAEPELFNSFIDAGDWATVSLTTVGYGDITPVTTMGKIITVVSSLVGVGIIALPSAVITAGYIEVYNDTRGKDRTE